MRACVRARVCVLLILVFSYPKDLSGGERRKFQFTLSRNASRKAYRGFSRPEYVLHTLHVGQID